MATKKPLLQFWNALDDIPNATTDRREWMHRLGSDWRVAASYLKSTGRLVREVACPAPGGDGCPRKVIEQASGRFRAVCGNKPAECDPIDLTRDEITCLAADLARLSSAVGAIFDASEDTAATTVMDPAIVVGSHGVAVGARIPIVLLIPGPTPPPTETVLSLLDGAAPIVVVVPTTRSLSPEIRSALTQRGHAVYFLFEIVTTDGRRLTAARPAAELLSPLRREMLASLSPAVPGRLWVLPPGARWENLTFDFIAEEVVNVQFGPETRRFEPEHFGLKSKKNGRPMSGWVLLRSIARQRGALTWKDPRASSTIKKQKQLLSSRLRSLFGIDTDPIPARRDGYQALFTIRDSTSTDRPARRSR